jgi:hypothetical protein
MKYALLLLIVVISKMNELLNKAEKWFAELGIQTHACATSLKVSRDGMCQFSRDSELPETTYDLVLMELQIALDSTRLRWGLKDDDWYWLHAF